MTHPVSLVMTFMKGRESNLERTLLSIERQNYHPLEVFVVEDGNSGTAAQLCSRFGARYLQVSRESEPIPSGRPGYWMAGAPFGNIPAVRNQAIRLCSHDVLVWHDSDVKHDGDVIAELATRVETDSKLVISAWMQNEDGKGGVYWNRHPSMNEPNSSSISAVNVIQRHSLLDDGCFDDSFNGYGFDDDFSWLIFRRNFKVEYSAKASCTHQWHEGIPFDHPSGRANRAIFFRLRHEIEKGLRPPIANHNSGDVLDAAFPTMNRDILDRIVRRVGGTITHVPEFRAWSNAWIGDRVPHDEDGEAERILEESLANKEDLVVLWAIVSAAYMVKCAENAEACGATAFVKPLIDWARTAATIADRGHR